MTPDLEPTLAALAPDAQEWLREAARAALERERAELEAAVDRAMEHVPWLLRGAVRKILFP